MITRRQFVLGSLAGTAILASRSRGNPTRYATAATETYGTITDLNLRSGPGLTYGVVRVLIPGTFVEIIRWAGQADGYTWAEVWASSHYRGYVAGEFLRPFGTTSTFPPGSPIHVETASGGSANLRSGPGLSGPVIRVVPDGTTGEYHGGEIAEEGYIWARVTMLGTTGWMATSVLGLGAGTTSAPFPVGSLLVVNTDVLNLRSGTSLASSVLAVLPAGTILTVEVRPVQGNGRSWYGVRTQTGISGWVAAEYVGGAATTAAEYPVGYGVRVVADQLNLREAPTTSAPILEVLMYGTALTVTGEPLFAVGYIWYPVVTSWTAAGWVASQYIW
jgi:N-acetylmuramoyl-L-alanine amidase